MGKDVRGTEGGKCGCGECEDFMRSDGATCGYCGCLPTYHSKKDARYSSDSVGGTDNPAVTGRFVEESFSAKRHDATTIKNNTDDLSKPKVKIDELNAKVTEDGNALFDSNGWHI